MSRKNTVAILSVAVLVSVSAVCATAQSFRVQCPTTTITHPNPASAEPAYNGPTKLVAKGGAH